jgi:DUF4097 and DUF4098 domain-containing protein YvlB
MVRFLEFFLTLITISVITAGCNVEINKPIRIADGSVETKSLNSINGSIIIGKDCQIKADCRAVNGAIEVGANSEVEDLQSVNGNISLSKGVIVNGDVSAVNGSINCEKDVFVKKDINTINGSIDLFKTHVALDVSTRNGNITLRDSTSVGGDIIIGDIDGQSKKHRHIDITIANNSKVDGDIIVEDDHVKVRVYLSTGGRVNGEVINAEVIEE